MSLLNLQSIIQSRQRKSTLFLLVVLSVIHQTGHTQMVFRSVDSLLTYSASRSTEVQSGYIRIDQAKKARLAAILSVPDITGSASLTYTHNTKLPVNLFPAETFGGQPGTFTEIKTGIPYVTNANENIDVKLINIKSWQNLKLYKLNLESSTWESKVTIKTFFEDVASTYFNVVSLQKQLESTDKNVNSSKALLEITKNKYKEGLIRQQDVNEANISYLTSKENYRQIEYQIKQQYLALKVLCDIPDQEDIKITYGDSLTAYEPTPAVTPNNITLNNILLKEKVALSNYKQQKYSLYPTLSFFQSYTTQQNSTRGKLFDGSVNWIPSSYIGLKLNLPIPSSSTFSQISKAKYEYLLAQKDTEHERVNLDLKTNQLAVDYDKAVSQAASYNEIYLLRKENYEKSIILYQEGQESLQYVLDGFNSMVSSNYNLVTAQVNVLSAKSKIDINNRIK